MARCLSMKRWLAVLFFILSAFLAWVQLGPIRTVWGIQACIRNGEAERLGQYIDFPAIRSDLKGQIRSKIEASQLVDSEDPMRFLMAQLSTQFTDTLVDGFLNPETIASVVNAPMRESSQVSSDDEGMGESEGLGGGGLDLEAIRSNPYTQAVLNRCFSLLSWTQFELVIENEGSDYNQAQVLFERRGLDLNWKITQFTLPYDFNL